MRTSTYTLCQEEMISQLEALGFEISHNGLNGNPIMVMRAAGIWMEILDNGKITSY